MLKLEDVYLTLELAQPSSFHYMWLRDNCACPACLHPDTQERILVSHTIPADIAPESAVIEGEELVIVWNQDQHESRYPLSWLQQHNYDQCAFDNDTASGTMTLWGSELQSNIPTYQYADLRNSNEALLSWFEAIRDVGLTIVRGAPNEYGEIERFAEHVAFVRETIYDRLHTVRATPGEYNAYNVASTTLELKPHTDTVSYTHLTLPTIA